MFPFRLCIFRVNPNSVSALGMFSTSLLSSWALCKCHSSSHGASFWLLWNGNFPLYGLCSSFIYRRTSVFSTTTWSCWFMFALQSTTNLSDLFLAELLQLNPVCVCAADCSCPPHTRLYWTTSFFPGFFPNLSALLWILPSSVPAAPTRL